jgi:hypothetical protein
MLDNNRQSGYPLLAKPGYLNHRIKIGTIISGEKVAFGPTHKGMIPFFEKWDNDFAVSIMSGNPLRPVTREVIVILYSCIG